MVYGDLSAGYPADVSVQIPLGTALTGSGTKRNICKFAKRERVNLVNFQNWRRPGAGWARRFAGRSSRRFAGRSSGQNGGAAIRWPIIAAKRWRKLGGRMSSESVVEGQVLALASVKMGSSGPLNRFLQVRRLCN